MARRRKTAGQSDADERQLDLFAPPVPTEPPALASRELLRAAVRGICPALLDDSPAFEAALVMYAALQLGSDDLQRLTEVTGVRNGVRLIAANLRAAGVWTADGRTAAEWDGAEGEYQFWFDVNVALGLFRKSARGPA